MKFWKLVPCKLNSTSPNGIPHGVHNTGYKSLLLSRLWFLSASAYGDEKIFITNLLLNLIKQSSFISAQQEILPKWN